MRLKSKKYIQGGINMIGKGFRFLQRIYYKLLASLSFKTIQHNGIVMFSHNFQRKGASLLLLYIAKEFQSRNIPIVIISQKSGPLVSDFKKVAKVYISNRYSKIESITHKLAYEYGYKKAICNTCVTGKFTKILKDNNYVIISMIHEMGLSIQLLEEENSCTEIAKYANHVLFPSSIVFRDFLKFTPNNTTFTYSIKPQGLYLTNDIIMDMVEAREVIKQVLPSITQENLLVINVASAEHRKGFDIFLDLCLESWNRQLPIQFVWVGDNAEILYQKYLVEKNIESIPNLCLPGYIKDKFVLQSIYLSADILCLTSREEPLGSIVLEAMHAGTPVLGFDGCGGFTDIIMNGENGFLVPPFSTEAILEKLMYIKDNKSVQKKLHTKSKETAKQYNFIEYCDYILSLFDTTIMERKTHE